MSKTINTILTIAIILCMAVLVIYGYYSIQRLDESKEAKVVSTISKHINGREEATIDSENINYNADDDNDENDSFEEYIEVDEEEEEELPEKLTEKIPEPIVPVSAPPINKSDASYLIIAGSFKSKSNAEKKVKLLKELGVSAEIVHLNNSKLHAICIAKSVTEKEANETKSMYKDKHSIKSYVYKIP